MSVTFELGQESVTLPDPESNRPMSRKERQVIGRTAGGEVVAYDKGVTTFETTLTFSSLNGTQKSDLTEFFADETEGTLNTFTYTDPNSDTHTARFLDPELEFTKVGSGSWSVSVRLELDGMEA